MSNTAGIYIHIPFCATRCHYCNFATGGYESEIARKYVAAVSREISNVQTTRNRPELWAKMDEVDTIYFGGGTPTTLAVDQITGLIDLCRVVFTIAPESEITTEANPGSVTFEYLEGLRSIGVNR